MSQALQFAEMIWSGRPVRIEYQWVGRLLASKPLLVFLHEGLGSLAMWKGFPQKLCESLGCRGLVYSRPGYGRSTPRAPDAYWEPDFMHRQANEVLPALLEVLAIDIGARPIWLFGHSDGASIALLYAARFPQGVSGCIVLAPHVMVEDVTVASIADARAAYLESDLRQRLARYHEDPDSAFWGWSQIWLQPSFRNWSITTEIKAIRCPLMAIQGLDDEYGSMAQIEGIVDKVAQTEVLALKDCGHAPHRDQPGLVVAAVSDFFQRHQSQLRGSTAVGVKPNSARNNL